MFAKKNFRMVATVASAAALLAVAGCGGGGGTVSSGNPAAIIPASALQLQDTINRPKQQGPPQTRPKPATQARAETTEQVREQPAGEIQEQPEKQPAPQPQRSTNGNAGSLRSVRPIGVVDAGLLSDLAENQHGSHALPDWAGDTARHMAWLFAAKKVSSIANRPPIFERRLRRHHPSVALFSESRARNFDTVRMSSGKAFNIIVREYDDPRMSGAHKEPGWEGNEWSAGVYFGDGSVPSTLDNPPTTTSFTSKPSYSRRFYDPVLNDRRLSASELSETAQNGVKYRRYGGEEDNVNGKTINIVGTAFSDKPEEPDLNKVAFSTNLDYLAYGIWLLVPNDAAANQKHAHHVGVAVSGPPISFSELYCLEGGATYTGSVVGKYFYRTASTQKISAFSGDVTLKATFNANPREDIHGRYTFGVIRGEIGNMRDAQGQPASTNTPGGGLYGLPDDLTLGQANIVQDKDGKGFVGQIPYPVRKPDPRGHRFHAALSGDGGYAGQWAGKFFGVPVAAEDISKTYPSRAGGTIAASSDQAFGSGSQGIKSRALIGVFGAGLKK